MAQPLLWHSAEAEGLPQRQPNLLGALALEAGSSSSSSGLARPGRRRNGEEVEPEDEQDEVLRDALRDYGHWSPRPTESKPRPSCGGDFLGPFWSYDAGTLEAAPACSGRSPAEASEPRPERELLEGGSEGEARGGNPERDLGFSVSVESEYAEYWTSPRVGAEVSVLSLLQAGLRIHAPDEGGFDLDEFHFFGKDEEAGEGAAYWGRGMSIDLGSSTLRVASWSGAEVQAHPELALPACVAFTSAGKVLLGHEAKSAAQQSPGNAFTVGTLLRRLHAQRETDPEGKEEPPYVVVASICGRPRKMLVAELLALLLWKVREMTQEHLGPEPVRAVVLSVPVACSLVQRRTLEEAVQLAGFQRGRLLRAPVGAALWRYRPSSTQLWLPSSKKPSSASSRDSEALDGQRRPIDERQVLLIDVGAGHLDCALVVIENGVFEVRWAGGCACGGADVDELLARICRERAGRPPSEPLSQRLLAACEKAKRCLSAAPSTRIQVPNLWGKEGLDLTVTAQELYEALRREILPKLTGCVGGLIEHGDQRSVAMPDRRDIDEVLFLGGSLKMPFIQRCLQELTSSSLRVRELRTGQTPQEGGAAALAHAQACGAALQGAILGDRRSEGGWLQSLMLIDTCSYSLGIQVEDGTAWVVPAHTPIPTTKDVCLRLKAQPGAIVHIREDPGLGRGSSAWLGAFAVPAPGWEDGAPREHMLNVKLEVDAAGRLHIEVAESAGRRAYALFGGRGSALSKEELTSLSSLLSTHAADRWMRYGQRAELPPRRSPSRNGRQWPSWPVEIVGREEEDVDEEDMGAGDDEESGPPSPPPEPVVRETRSAGRPGDARAKAYAERLRRKVDERRQKAVGQRLGPQAVDEATTAGETATGDDFQHLSTSEVCSVCLCTEAELGRPFHWVFEKCGHKCICKNCLRKMKSRQKRVQVECPMCRVHSKPVLLERYVGDIYAAEADP